MLILTLYPEGCDHLTLAVHTCSRNAIIPQCSRTHHLLLGSAAYIAKNPVCLVTTQGRHPTSRFNLRWLLSAIILLAHPAIHAIHHLLDASMLASEEDFGSDAGYATNFLLRRGPAIARILSSHFSANQDSL